MLKVSLQSVFVLMLIAALVVNYVYLTGTNAAHQTETKRVQEQIESRLSENGIDYEPKLFAALERCERGLAYVRNERSSLIEASVPLQNIMDEQARIVPGDETGLLCQPIYSIAGPRTWFRYWVHVTENRNAQLSVIFQPDNDKVEEQMDLQSILLTIGPGDTLVSYGWDDSLKLFVNGEQCFDRGAGELLRDRHVLENANGLAGIKLQFLDLESGPLPGFAHHMHRLEIRFSLKLLDDGSSQ